MTYRSPQQCRDMQDIRAEIDAIDRQIIALLGRRIRYVEAATAFKRNAAAVRADERVDAMIGARRQWAEEEQLPPDLIEKVYRMLVDGFIQHEMTQWQHKP